MQLENISQILKYRSSCLCGSPLCVNFIYSSSKISKEDHAYHILPQHYCISRDSKFIELVFEIISSNQQCQFVIHGDIYTNKIRCYPQKYSTDTNLNPPNFIKDIFNQDVQKEMNILMELTCSSNKCKYSYNLISEPLLFDIENQNIHNIGLRSEYFLIEGEENGEYLSFSSKFKDKYVSINYHAIRPRTPSANGLISVNSPAQNIININIPINTFKEYPFDKNFLSEKIKTWLVFL